MTKPPVSWAIPYKGKPVTKQRLSHCLWKQLLWGPYESELAGTFRFASSLDSGSGCILGSVQDVSHPRHWCKRRAGPRHSLLSAF
ncbi:hypothetical protein CgunFtcFv8_003866 [Champsocephalus gunnari]|uniref:Uncharacterized protein n=1 Tax=Champsocephalus gunnari TaxID=52237 RepID=A0AAN8HXM8_CHAGU|nr:hypothetical protein CgunFtcFv8_003866 [Champsocephalus gunnari]